MRNSHFLKRTEALVRTRKYNDREGHLLSGDGKGRDLSGQKEAGQEGCPHSLSGDGKWRGSSGHRKKLNERGTLTFWRRQREGVVRTRKQTDRPRCTHVLNMLEGGTCQDNERNRLIEVHSRPGEGRGRDLSGHGNKPTDQGALTSWRRYRERFVRTQNKPTDRGALTSWRR